MLLFTTIGLALTALAHMWPAPFVIDWMAGDRAVWAMPATGRRTVYLTFDDGPNPSTTPDLLDVLAAEGARATFFIIDDHLNEGTAPIVRRAFAEGHAVALHSSTRRPMLMPPGELSGLLNAAADRIEALTGGRPCRAFRPHAGWRSGQLYAGLEALDYRLIGFGWMLWDFNWFRARNADSSVRRIVPRASDGDIIVMHDGDESAPVRDQRHTVDATRRLIPELRSRGFAFGTICPAQSQSGDRGRLAPAPDIPEREHHDKSHQDDIRHHIDEPAHHSEVGLQDHPGRCEERCPTDGAESRIRDEAAQRHPCKSGRQRDQGPHARHESSETDGPRSV